MSETELILTIIQQAVIDLKTDITKFKTKQARIEAQIRKERAEKWLMSKSKGRMTFDWYCNLIDLDSNWARQKIKKNGHL
uniref:Uncharacterized protein n=1 Tax=viral metagenome TaxID=1070528 RepID=A0A6M3LPH2_9ZZZZ